MMAVDECMSRFEEVFTETDYYDGPRQGIANFCGSPHFYACVLSDDRQDYTNRYTLTRISNEAFRLAIEDWAIWTRWDKAFKAGETTLDTHPALPDDADRHAQITSILADELKAGSNSSFIRSAKFLILNPPEERGGTRINLLVEWSEPTGPISESIWAKTP